MLKMAVFLLFLFVIMLGNDVNGHELKRLVIFGRHSVRTPLNVLTKLSPKPWPKWKDKLGHITQKGILLESYMGDYFSAWLKKEGLFSDECPSEDSVYIYANAKQRTRKSAEIFVKNAFKNCSITVQYKPNVHRDPLFTLMVTNNSAVFRHIARKEMQNKIDQLRLTDAFLKLNGILDFENSEICKETSICDLTAAKEQILFNVGELPDTYGPLKFGFMTIDSFLTQYYNDAPLESIGWGAIKPEDWKSLVDIYTKHINVCFNCTNINKELLKPAISFFTNVLLNEEKKFTLLVGHDGNQMSLMEYMGFKYYELKNQFEKFPVGGKIVFQKWYDKQLDRYLLKINYVYQSFEQVRDGQRLSLENPPEWTVLEIKGCDIDEDGYCLWDDFVKLANTF